MITPQTTAYPGVRSAIDVLTEIRDVYDVRSELFTNDEDCAANLADRARLYLASREAEEPDCDD